MREQAGFAGAGGEIGDLASSGRLAGDVAADGRTDAVDDLGELGQAGVGGQGIGFSAAHEHDELALPSEFPAEAFDLGEFEALHEAGGVLGVVPILTQDRQDRAGEVVAFLAMPAGRFELRVDADVPCGGAVQLLDELDLFLERHDRKRADADREATREGGLAGLGIEALGDVELLQFGDREIEGVESSVRPLTAGELLWGVRRGVDVRVMEDHRHAVLAEHHVLLEIVGALPVGEGLRRERVFGQIAARATMRDDQRTRLRRGEGAEGEEEGEQGGSKHGDFKSAKVQKCKGGTRAKHGRGQVEMGPWLLRRRGRSSDTRRGSCARRTARGLPWCGRRNIPLRDRRRRHNARLYPRRASCCHRARATARTKP